MLKGELDTFIQFNSGNSGLTQEFIYENLPMGTDEKIIVLSASKYYKKIMGYIKRDVSIGNRKLKTYNGETILVVRKGLAGKMHYYKELEYTINEDAYVITVRDKYKDKINLQWFAYFFQKLFFNITTAREGNGTFSKEYAKQQYVEIPELNVQREELKLYSALEQDREKIDTVLEQTDKCLKRIITADCMEKYNIKDLFYMDTGKRILKQGLYSIINPQCNNKEEIIPIVSSGIENEGIFGYASIQWLNTNYRRKVVRENEWEAWNNYINASYIIDEPCVTWNTDGAAGTLFYRENKFFPTDHCGVLIPKDKYKDKVNLKYFAYSQQYNFKQNSERGNLHLQEMSAQVVELPPIQIQNQVCHIIECLMGIKEKLLDQENKIDQIMKRELCMVES